VSCLVFVACLVFVLSVGLWVMGYGLWVMGYGLWVMGYGEARIRNHVSPSLSLSLMFSSCMSCFSEGKKTDGDSEPSEHTARVTETARVITAAHTL
jgi:hypothetical protein